MLRNRVLPGQGKGKNESAPGANTVSALSSTAIASVPITTELLAGQLPVMMLKTWLDRDEDGRKAVPVLLGNMRFRVGDSVGLKQEDATGREMFKVECEYGDGAVKWVRPLCSTFKIPLPSSTPIYDTWIELIPGHLSRTPRFPILARALQGRQFRYLCRRSSRFP
jgi:hypothetical protein